MFRITPRRDPRSRRSKSLVTCFRLGLAEFDPHILPILCGAFDQLTSHATDAINSLYIWTCLWKYIGDGLEPLTPSTSFVISSHISLPQFKSFSPLPYLNHHALLPPNPWLRGRGNSYPGASGFICHPQHNSSLHKQHYLRWHRLSARHTRFFHLCWPPNVHFALLHCQRSPANC